MWNKFMDFFMKAVAVIVFIFLAFACLGAASNACEVKKVIFRHNSEFFDTGHFVWHGRMVVPLRTLSERFNVQIYWNDAAKEATIRPDPNTLYSFRIDDNVMYKNDEPYKTMDTFPVVRDGRLFVPLRFAVEALGKHVRYYEDTCVKLIHITDYLPTQDLALEKKKGDK